MKDRPRAPTRKTEEAVDRLQNNKYMLRQRGPRHCAATSVLRNCFFSCCAEQSHKDNVRSTAAEEQLKQKKSNFLRSVLPGWVLPSLY